MRFREPLWHMKYRVGDLKQLVKHYRSNAEGAGTDDIRKIYDGLVIGVEKEIAEFEEAIKFLELGEQHDEAVL